MLITLEIKGQPLNGDILVFNGKEFESVGKNRILGGLTKKIMTLETQNKELEEKFNKLVSETNIKLKNYHLILQNLTKGE